MHLESMTEQTAALAGTAFAFRRGETIHTENSYKYSIAEFQALARRAGFSPLKVWTDPDDLFSIHFLEVAG